MPEVNFRIGFCFQWMQCLSKGTIGRVSCSYSLQYKNGIIFWFRKCEEFLRVHSTYNVTVLNASRSLTQKAPRKWRRTFGVLNVKLSELQKDWSFAFKSNVKSNQHMQRNPPPGADNDLFSNLHLRVCKSLAFIYWWN